MKDPVISRFAEACSATGPLDMRVDLADGGLLAEGTIPMPFSLIGRDDACDVTLTDAEVNPRHAWLQILGGRVFAVDLGSRTGLTWPGGGNGSGWLDVGVPVRIGPFQLLLRSPVANQSVTVPHGYNPLVTDQNISRLRPTVSLEFRNGKRAKDRWTINRLITLIGRSPECKIRLTADDIAGYHCGLVLTPDGIWVVDLSGRGVVVNGERMRVSPLRQGAELWIGRFLIGIQYPTVNTSPAAVRPGTLTAPNPLPGMALSTGPIRTGSSISRPTPEDEVELGAVPTSETGSGLPSSHIMADAFRLWGNAGGIVTGPVSNPILLSGSGPTPPVIPVAPPSSQPRLTHRPNGSVGNYFTSSPESSSVVAQLLGQLDEIHGQMFAQLYQSLVLMVQLFGCLGKEQLPAMQRELSRIQELNDELAELQGEVARRAGEVCGPPTPSRMPPARLSPSTPNPIPEPPSSHVSSLDSTGLQHWVLDRLNTLQQERQTRWQSLVGMFSGKG